MYRWLDHTSELELSIEAGSIEGVIEQGTAAMAELWSGLPRGEPIERCLRVRAGDPPALLAEWLNELVYRSETESFTPERVERLELGDGVLEGVVSGHRSEPQTLVKAVTYHRLELRSTDDGWRARVVLDV